MTLDIIKSAAEKEGFSLLGATPAISPSGYNGLLDWIEQGFSGEMHYFADRREAYRHPNAVLDGVRSIVMLAFPYTSTPAKLSSSRTEPRETLARESREMDRGVPNASDWKPDSYGLIARYASFGDDYHDLLHPKLKRLCKVLETIEPDSKNRGVVDTAPIMEREFAQLAGLGWMGKNTLLINKHQGSYFFLACVLTSIDLNPTQSHPSSHCGSCTACLDACPTDAFPEPGKLDARKCISYLTIEHRGSIEMNLRAKIGNWLFGCDICQEVCPWNTKPVRRNQRKEQEKEQNSTETWETTPHPASEVQSPTLHRSIERGRQLELTQLFTMDEDEFRSAFRKTPMWRPRRRGLLRNAAIVLGNQKKLCSLPALELGLNDSEPIVRGASAWALGNFQEDTAKQLLLTRERIEKDPEIQQEIAWALKKSQDQ